jgi:hypothetical protein
MNLFEKTIENANAVTAPQQFGGHFAPDKARATRYQNMLTHLQPRAFNLCYVSRSH